MSSLVRIGVVALLLLLPFLLPPSIPGPPPAGLCWEGIFQLTTHELDLADGVERFRADAFAVRIAGSDVGAGDDGERRSGRASEAPYETKPTPLDPVTEETCPRDHGARRISPCRELTARMYTPTARTSSR